MNVSLGEPKPPIYEKTPWPFKEGIIEEDQSDLRPQDYIRSFAQVAERKLGWKCHHLLTKSFSVSIAIKNKEVISPVFLR